MIPSTYKHSWGPGWRAVALDSQKTEGRLWVFQLPGERNCLVPMSHMGVR